MKKKERYFVCVLPLCACLHETADWWAAGTPTVTWGHECKTNIVVRDAHSAQWGSGVSNVWFETEYNVNISSSVNDPFTAQWNEEEITSGTSVFFSSHCSVWAASWGFPFSKHTPTHWNKTAQTKHTPDSSFIRLGQWKESKMEEMCVFVYRSYNTTVIWMKKLVYTHTHTAELWPG